MTRLEQKFHAQWATGADGADCTEPSSLTQDAALYEETWGQPLRQGWRFVKTSNTGIRLYRVVVSNSTMAHR